MKLKKNQLKKKGKSRQIMKFNFQSIQIVKDKIKKKSIKKGTKKNLSQLG
jgi:hypothetical protein